MSDEASNHNGSESTEQAPQQFRLQARGVSDQHGPDGALYRVHTFFVINEEGKIVTDETDEGQQPIILQSVPMRVKKPSRLATVGGMVVH